MMRDWEFQVPLMGEVRGSTKEFRKPSTVGSQERVEELVDNDEEL